MLQSPAFLGSSLHGPLTLYSIKKEKEKSALKYEIKSTNLKVN